MHPLPIRVSAKFNLDIFHSKQDMVIGIFHIRSNNCLANERFFDYHFASFASPHSNTRQCYDIGCRRHGICDHGSMSTLVTKLFRKKRIILPSVHLSQIVLSAVTSVFLILSASNLVGRSIRSQCTSLQNFISIYFIVNKISLLASFIYGALTVWPMRGFSTNISLLSHHHIRTHANIMTLDAVDTEYVTTVRCPH